MRSVTGKVVNCAVAGLLFWLTGCATKGLPKHTNPYLGYVHCKAIEKYDSQADLAVVRMRGGEYEQSIVSSELKKRLALKPADSVRQIAPWISYVNELRRPVPVTEGQCLNGKQFLKEKARVRIREYWQDIGYRLSIDGKAVSRAWGRELEEAESRLSSLQADRKLAVQNLVGHRKEKEYFKALDLFPELRSYGDIGALEDKVREEAVNYWVDSVKEGLEEAKTLDMEPREDRLASLFVKIGEYSEKSGRARRFAPVLKKTIEALGNTWRKQIMSLGEDQQYWKAYELAVDKLTLLDRYKPHRESLLQSVGIGYNKILDGAMQYYADLANSRFSEDLYGVAYIYSCMAAQMYDFCVLPAVIGDRSLAAIDPSAEALEWSGNNAALAADIEESIQALLARRLIIFDFDSDPRQLAGKLREECARRYGRAGNNLAWALSVPDDEPLNLETLPPPKPNEQDYVVSGEITDYRVEKVMDQTTPLGILDVGSDIIEKIVNPGYKIKELPFSSHKTIWSQEVLLYPRSKVDRQKKVSVDIQAACDHGEEKSLELYAVRKEFADHELKAKIRVEDVVYGAPQPSRHPRLNPDRMKLTVQSLPKNTQHHLSDDTKIYKEVDGIVIEEFMAELDDLVVQYPVELLAKGYQGNVRPNETLEEKCNRLGLVLMYCNKLTEGELEKQKIAGAGLQWMHRLSRINRNIKEWSADRWSGQSQEILNGPDGISSLWENGRSSALILQEKQQVK